MNNHVPETEKYIKLFFFFLKNPPPTEIYPLPLHDALPICVEGPAAVRGAKGLDLHVEAAAGASVLVHEHHRRTPAALLAVELHPVDRSEGAHSARSPQVFKIGRAHV